MAAKVGSVAPQMSGDGARTPAVGRTHWYWVGLKLVPRTDVVHIRLYTHHGDGNHNAAWGDYVLCTTHFDNNELGRRRARRSGTG